MINPGNGFSSHWYLSPLPLYSLVHYRNPITLLLLFCLVKRSKQFRVSGLDLYKWVQIIELWNIMEARNLSS